MDTQIKKAIKSGNSSAVILPRAWLNKEVRVELLRKTNETILIEVIEILKNNNVALENLIGVYLVGSYARGEEDDKSDMDILIITKNIDLEMIEEGIYNILVISSELLNQKLDQDLFPIGQMIKEARPIINSSYLDSIEVNVTKRNTKWYLETTKDKLKIIKKVLDKAKNKKIENLSNRIAYTLVLRIRTLHIIEKLIKNENYSKRNFIKIINTISGGTSAYEEYLVVKDNLEEEKITTLEETEKLYKYLEEQLDKVRKIY